MFSAVFFFFLFPVRAILHCITTSRVLSVRLEPATHRRKSPGVLGAAIAIFAGRRDRRIKSSISGMSDMGT